MELLNNYVKYHVITKDNTVYCNENRYCFSEIMNNNDWRGISFSQIDKIQVFLKNINKNEVDIIEKYLEVLNAIENSLMYDKETNSIYIKYTTKNMLKLFLTSIRYLWEGSDMTNKRYYIEIVNNAINFFNNYNILALNALYLGHYNVYLNNNNHTLTPENYTAWFFKDETPVMEFLKKESGTLFSLHKYATICKKHSLDDLIKAFNLELK